MADVTINNNLSVTLGTYSTLDYPAIAIAFGYCALRFSSTNSAHDAGNVHTLTMGDYSIKVTLDQYGKAEVSLLPFIRAYMASQNVQNLPLETDATNTSEDNAMRGVFNIAVSEANTSTTEETIKIHFIYGTNQLERITDKYINYNTNDSLKTWQTFNEYSGNDAHGVPSDDDDWIACNVNINLTYPSAGATLQMAEAQYIGDKIVNGIVNYHLIEDCRANGVKAVKWLDKYGGINIRKLTFAGVTTKATHSDAYNRPHIDRNVANGNYYAGDDMWETLTPTTTYNLGDDSIPMELYDWLSGLVTSPVVEMWSGDVKGTGKWLRCNIGDVTIERDPRKATFSLSLSLIVPNDMIQQF